MNDHPLPAECLAEYRNELVALKSGAAVLPPWFSKEDLPRLIRETEGYIKLLEEQLAKNGNSWLDKENQ